MSGTKYIIFQYEFHKHREYRAGQQCVQLQHRNRNKVYILRWRQNEGDGVSNHRRLYCLPNRLFSRRSNKTSKLRVTGLCVGNLPVTGEFPVQRASNAKNVSIWWRHHEFNDCCVVYNAYRLTCGTPDYHQDNCDYQYRLHHCRDSRNDWLRVRVSAQFINSQTPALLRKFHVVVHLRSNCLTTDSQSQAL